eukprot:6876692-Pyramimonas_sp.AAC.1
MDTPVARLLFLTAYAVLVMSVRLTSGPALRHHVHVFPLSLHVRRPHPLPGHVDARDRAVHAPWRG